MSRPLREQSMVVIKRLMGARCRDLLELHQPAPDFSHLEIQQMRRVTALDRVEHATLNPVPEFCAKYELDGRRSIDDDQRLSRSARTESDAAILPRCAARPSQQAFTAIKTGNIGAGGATGDLLLHTLKELDELTDPLQSAYEAHLQITFGVSAFGIRAGIRPWAQGGRGSESGRRRRSNVRKRCVQFSSVMRELRKLFQSEPERFLRRKLANFCALS